MHSYLNLIKCVAIVSVIFVIFYLNNTSYLKKTKVEIPSETPKPLVETTTDVVEYKMPRTRTKYILLWTNPNTFPYLYFGEGNSIFAKKRCKYINCYVTSNRQFLRDTTAYDIVAFNGPQLVDSVANDDLPRVRSSRQKYVYTNIEAAVNYPVCTSIWDDFFNWTWTYKINSDAVWGYVVIQNSSNHVIGPSANIDWMSIDDMSPIDQETRAKLATKNKAAAWFVSNCNTISKREEFVNELQSYINNLNLKIDVYGSCGTFQCPVTIMDRCLDELERGYYFYLAFENAISEDYVTEKILHALDHYTVPIVYGGADYSRFLPPGSYLNAYKLGAQSLAQEIYDIIENRELYYRFFRWRKYYTIRLRHLSPDTDDYCRFCAMANDEDLMNKFTNYDNFSSWWTPAEICAKHNTYY